MGMALSMSHMLAREYQAQHEDRRRMPLTG
jgi:hypothetical protein